MKIMIMIKIKKIYLMIQAIYQKNLSNLLIIILIMNIILIMMIIIKILMKIIMKNYEQKMFIQNKKLMI